MLMTSSGSCQPAAPGVVQVSWRSSDRYEAVEFARLGRAIQCNGWPHSFESAIANRFPQDDLLLNALIPHNRATGVCRAGSKPSYFCNTFQKTDFLCMLRG